MKRRTYLAASTGLVGTITGCAGSDIAGGESQGEPTQTPESTATPEGDGDGGDGPDDGELEPAKFEFVALEPGNESVGFGETVEIAVTVANVGEAAGERRIHFRVGNDFIDETDVALEGGEETTLTTSLNTMVYSEGDQDYGFYSDDDTVAGTLTITVEEPEPVSLSGDGAGVTDPFEIEGGMVVTEWEYSGEGEFTVELRDQRGNERDRRVAEGEGDAEGTWGEGLSGGEYVVAVDADGSWQVDVLQPRRTLDDGDSVPHTETGDAAGGWFVFNTEETVRVNGYHRGSGNFVVKSYEIDGTTHSDTLVFDAHPDVFRDDTTFTYDFGATFFVVQADGEWFLEFRKL